MFKKETEDREVRKARLEEFKSELDRIFVEPLVARYDKADDFQKKKIRDGIRQNMIHHVRAYLHAKERAEGVNTRHGTHNRHEKLRSGERVYDHGESVLRWWVLDVEEGWLADLEREADVRFDIDDYYSASRRRDEINEYIEDHIANLVEKRYNARPASVDIHASYSPTGRWFATLHAWQVGRRLLVENQSTLDV